MKVYRFLIPLAGGERKGDEVRGMVSRSPSRTTPSLFIYEVSSRSSLGHDMTGQGPRKSLN
jgi:hypothetical protein